LHARQSDLKASSGNSKISLRTALSLDITSWESPAPQPTAAGAIINEKVVTKTRNPTIRLGLKSLLNSSLSIVYLFLYDQRIFLFYFKINCYGIRL